MKPIKYMKKQSNANHTDSLIDAALACAVMFAFTGLMMYVLI
jgi:hypothetical protein